MWLLMRSDNTVSDFSHLPVGTSGNPLLRHSLDNFLAWTWVLLHCNLNLSLFSAERGRRPTPLFALGATGCSSLGANVSKMRKSWSSTAIWMDVVAKAIISNIREVICKSLNLYLFILPILKPYQVACRATAVQCCWYKLVKYAYFLREFIV